MICPRKIHALCFVLLLAGCGGGDGGGASGVTVSGKIIAAANTIADKDTQDPNAPKTNNSIPENAQSLSNPGTVGGNVSFSVQDASDYYQVFLRTDDTVVLQVVDANLTSSVNNDLQIKLFLFNSASGVYEPNVASNNSTAPQTKSLKSQADGDYLIQVEAISGSSNYVLNVGSNVVVLSKPADIVPGEVLVKFKNTLTGIAVKNNFSDVLSVASSDKILQDVFHFRLKRKPTLLGAQVGLYAVSVDETLALIRSLNQRPDVVYAEPNYRYKALAVIAPNDPLFPSQWNLSNINLPQGWQQVSVGSPVTVAVLDSGVRFNHPDLSNQFISDASYSTGRMGYDFLVASESFDGDGPDDDPTDPGDPSLTGSTFHGTLVSGIVAAETHNATGIVGVSNTALVRLLPLRILSSTGGRSSEICQAILFAAKLSSAGGKTLAQPVDVINMSFGTTAFSQTLLGCITQARAQGVILVAAAGNESSSQPIFPASYDGVISVSATTLDKKLASYSNTGAAIDIAAPGGDSQDLNADGHPDGILTTSADIDSLGNVSFGYRFASGTSMSAPHVAGVFALMKSIDASLTPAILDQWLVAGLLTEDLTPQAAGADAQFGYGLLDARAALTQAKVNANGTVTLIPPLLASTPRGLSFGATIDNLNITLSNAGAGSLIVDAPVISYQQGSNWLNLSSNNGLGTYAVSVSRSLLSPGNYAATVTFASNANTLTIPVTINIPTIDIKADTGFLYVLLTNASGTKTLHSATAQAINGQYSFSIPHVSPGNYQIYVGTDMDKDNVICDPGEACGAYAALDRVLNVTVGNKNVSGIKMSSAFAVNQGSLSLSIP